MATDYTHGELNVKVESISGHYVIEKEIRLPYKGREALVVFGYALVDKSCCGGSGCRFANVPGYIVEWQSRKAADGAPVSVVEPIEDKTEKNEIQDIIDKTEMYCQVNFL
ncbi:MAG: hypothetical protein WCX65_09560 [bacterium]